jgi:hypothetical protein
MKVIYGMTPATATETHDFFALGRDYEIDDAALSDFQLEQQLAVMREDVDALEVQELMVANEPPGALEAKAAAEAPTGRPRPAGT